MAVTLRRMERTDSSSAVRIPITDDVRVVRLTPKGRKLSQLMRSAAAEVQVVAAAGLSSAEVKDFFRLTSIMTKNLNAERFGKK